VIEEKNSEKKINREYRELYVLLKLSPALSAALWRRPYFGDGNDSAPNSPLL
jgi:hypothetical protein